MQAGQRIVAAADSEPRRCIGHLFGWKVTGEATGGAFSLVEITGWQGGEPPLHVHTREDEFFYVIEGEATFMVGDEVRRVGPGGFVWAPREVPHAFAFETPVIRMLAGFLPAGQEAVFRAFSAPDPARRAPAPPSPEEAPDLEAVQRLDERAGVTYAGPPLRALLAGRAAPAPA